MHALASPVKSSVKQQNHIINDDIHHQTAMAPQNNNARPTNLKLQTRKSPGPHSMPSMPVLDTTPTKIAAFALDQVESATSLVDNDLNFSKRTTNVNSFDTFEEQINAKSPNKAVSKFDFA
jgi:hypothetical protein